MVVKPSKFVILILGFTLKICTFRLMPSTGEQIILVHIYLMSLAMLIIMPHRDLPDVKKANNSCNSLCSIAQRAISQVLEFNKRAILPDANLLDHRRIPSGPSHPIRSFCQ